MISEIAKSISYIRFLFWKTIMAVLGGEMGEGTAVYEGVKFFKSPGASFKIGKKAILQKGVVLAASVNGNLTLGDDVYLGEYVVVSSRGRVAIGDHVIVASHTFIVDFDHKFDDPKQLINEQGYNISHVVIEKDVWIGAGCKILRGVTIGEGSVIGAGSVVTKDIPPYSVCAGVPARVIHQRGAQLKE